MVRKNRCNPKIIEGKYMRLNFTVIQSRIKTAFRTKHMGLIINNHKQGLYKEKL